MDETTRLCEECGYIVEGLPDGAVCPECGAAVPRTRDERRPGTAWQRSPGLTGWLSVSWSMLRCPGITMSAARIDAPASLRLLRWNTLLAAMGISAAGVQVLGFDSAPRTPFECVALFRAFAACSLAAALLITALSAIEARGIRFFGARRGWRITPAVATTICGHASIGWAIGGALVVGASAAPHVQREPAIAVAFFAGLLLFECLVYIGVRRCRYANPPDSVIRTAAGRA